jgi:hypothetical protein
MCVCVCVCVHVDACVHAHHDRHYYRHARHAHDNCQIDTNQWHTIARLGHLLGNREYEHRECQ